jgi:outer membrane protein TolC
MAIEEGGGSPTDHQLSRSIDGHRAQPGLGPTRSDVSPPRCRTRLRPGLILLVPVLLAFAGCMVGPNYQRPKVSVSPSFGEGADPRLSAESTNYRDWWKAFNDPVLDRLIARAYRDNLTLRQAGVKVLQARAQLGIAVGEIFPQTQQAIGTVQYNRTSDRAATAAFFKGGGGIEYWQSTIGGQASWELDFWGRIRRGIQSADASLLATLADYENTQATLPTLETQRRQARDALAVLLGMAPNDLGDLLDGPSAIPVSPPQVIVGIPADLLRRRPDIRSAELQAVAQSAQIGVAKADLLPAFSLIGQLVLLSTDLGTFRLSDMFRWGSRQVQIGPSVQWNILNYGQITNNVRVQDANFQQLLLAYQRSVLSAQQDVEDNLSAFFRSQDRADLLAKSVTASRSAVDLAVLQYREGVTDFTTVLTTQQTLLTQQDNLASTLGNISTGLVGVYRALGGGWEIREGEDIVPAEIKEEMRQRTNWGRLLAPATYNLPASREPQSRPRLPDW